MKALFASWVEQAKVTEVGQQLAEILQFERLNFRFLGQKLCHTGLQNKSTL